MFKRWIAPLFFLLALCTLIFQYHRSKGDRDGQRLEQKSQILFRKAAEELGRAWRGGRYGEGKHLECSSFFSPWPQPVEILKCNPLFLKCVFENKPYRGERGERVFFRFKQGPLPYKIISRFLSKDLRPDYALEVWMEIKGAKLQTQRVWLEDICSSRYLPQRVYGYGKKTKRKDFLWDNFGQHWFIDRRQVTHREIHEWVEQTGRKLREKLSSRLEDHYRSVGSLYPEEMQAYCEFRGKQVAQAHLLDGAFFFPRPPSSRGPYPWGKMNFQNFLSQLEKGGANLKYCQKIPSRECQNELKSFEGFSSSPTWMGVFQALGGLPEFVKNPLFPRRNINISSFYFPLESPVHEIGNRVHWDGMGFQRFHFSLRTFSLPEEISQLQIGFRCMKKRQGSEKF